jgi:hypothetical protein
MIAEPLGMLGEVERVAKREGSVAAFDDRREIENGQCCHALDMGRTRSAAIGRFLDASARPTL